MLTKLEKDNLEIFVLSFLRRQPSYVYEIIASLSPILKISESTLYPIVRRLCVQGQLETYSVQTNGRTRKYYRITEIGSIRIDEFQQDLENINQIFSYILRLNKKPS